MRVVAVVQARLGSTRLPGKVLLPLAGTTVVEHVLTRLRRCARLDDVVLATSALTADDPLVGSVGRLATVVRGSELDVLERYALAAEASRADVVVRVTSDCPLIDPGVVDAVIGLLLDRATADGSLDVDYASNTQQRSFPRGLDVEAFTREALDAAHREARDPFEREHVTPFIWQRPERFAIAQHVWPTDETARRWTLDTPEDYAFLKRVFDSLGARALDTPWTDVLALVARHPKWEALNAHVQQKTR
ncbi:MAG: glycosyltransferase family protein [Planctomycetota bacterium]